MEQKKLSVGKFARACAAGASVVLQLATSSAVAPKLAVHKAHDIGGRQPVRAMAVGVGHCLHAVGGAASGAIRGGGTRLQIVRVQSAMEALRDIHDRRDHTLRFVNREASEQMCCGMSCARQCHGHHSHTHFFCIIVQVQRADAGAMCHRCSSAGATVSRRGNLHQHAPQHMRPSASSGSQCLQALSRQSASAQQWPPPLNQRA